MKKQKRVENKYGINCRERAQGTFFGYPFMDNKI